MDNDIFSSADFLAQVDQVIAQHEHTKARRGAQNNTNGSPHDAAPPPGAHGQPGAAQRAPRQPESGAWPPPQRTMATAAAPRAPTVAAAPRRAAAAMPAAWQRPAGPGVGLGSPTGGGRSAPAAPAEHDGAANPVVTSLPDGRGPSASGSAGAALPAPQPAVAPSQQYYPSSATQPYGLGNGSLLDAQLAGPPPLPERSALRAAERERDELQRRLNEASGQASLLRSRAERTEREKRDLQAR